MDEEIKILTDDKLEQSITDDAGKMYMQEIRQYPNLSVEEQKTLGRRYRENGDLEAEELLINCNLRLVVSIATKYKTRLQHLQLLDIIQEGNLGLMKAIEKYDPDIGAFSTYAVPWIKSMIDRSIKNTDDEIRKPVHIVELKNKYLALIREYYQKRIPLPSDEEFCKILNITKGTLERIRESLKQNPISLNKTIGDDNEDELADIVIIKNRDYDSVLNQMVDNNIMLVLKEKEVLSPLQYFVIYHRILSDEPKTLEEVAKLLGVTREWVRQIESSAKRKIKPYMQENSKLFTKTLNKIQQREGFRFDSLKTTPLSPINIIRYMYLKDDLTDLERKLYELNLLGRYNYRIDELTSILEITPQELKSVIISLKTKINKKFSNTKEFKKFKEQMIKTYGTGIFNIDINKKVRFINYPALDEKYSSLSLDEILNYFKDINYPLTPNEENLLKKYFGMPNNVIHERDIEKEVNVLIFGFRKKEKLVSRQKLYKEYLRIKPKFSEEQQLYLETYFFGKKNRSLFDAKYPNSSLYSAPYFLINILERSYYHIYEYFEKSFTKENWLEVKEKYKERFTNENIKYLDLYYGVKEKPSTIDEIAQMFHMDYIKVHDIIKNARDLAINLFSGIKRKIEIDKDLYIPYITDLHYDFTKETRLVLKLFIIEGKSYDEISEITGSNKTRISNIITDGIRKIDNYRFGIIDSLIISEEELNAFFEYYKDNFTPIEKEVLRLKHLNHMENKDIAPIVNKKSQEVNEYVKHFNTLYESYIIRDVNLTDKDINGEIERHKSESIWSEAYKEFASFYFGIKNEYNSTGVKLNTKELMKKFGYSKNVCYHISTNMIKQLKERKIGFIKPENNFISRAELDNILDDVHLPISDKEREIICYLFELKGYPFKTLDELTSVFDDNKGSIKRRYQRAIVSIYKYLGHEIEGTINYETDIVPILKYFGINDRRKIEDFYKNGLTYEKMTIKYGVTFDKIVTTMNRLKTTIYDLMNNPNAKKFDFDYYMEAIHNPDLPYEGDLSLVVKVFNLMFGMDGKERMSIPEIKEMLQLDFAETTISKAISFLMLSVCKLKDGIKKDKTFPFEQVYSYFNDNYDDIPFNRQKVYLKYFNSKKQKNLNGLGFKLSNDILYDLIKENYPNAFTLKTISREDVLKLIKNYNKELNGRTKRELMGAFDIRERDFMNGKDINHVFKLLYVLDTRMKELNTQTLELKKYSD